MFRSSWTADEASAVEGRIEFATIGARPRGTDGNTRPPWWVPSRPWRASGFKGGGASGWNGPAPFRLGDTGLSSGFIHLGNPANRIPPEEPLSHPHRVRHDETYQNDSRKFGKV